MRELSKDAYNYISPDYLEGRCAICESSGVYVMPVDLPICNFCKTKYIGKEYVQFVRNMKPHGWCFYKGHYSKRVHKYNIADLQFNICVKCNLRLSKNGALLDKLGHHGVSPRWQKLRKEYGKDYKEILELEPTKKENKIIKEKLAYKIYHDNLAEEKRQKILRKIRVKKLQQYMTILQQKQQYILRQQELLKQKKEAENIPRR